MKYALKLAEDYRVMSATYAQYGEPEDPVVDELPDGNICEYKYIDGTFVYDPRNKPEKPKADTRITSGEYFTVDGNIYRATTTIPAGDIVSPGTNCVSINVVDILNEGRTS